MKKSSLLALVLAVTLLGGVAPSFATVYVYKGKKYNHPHAYVYTDTDGNKHHGFWSSENGVRTWNSLDK